MKRIIILFFVLLSSGWLYANHWTPEGAQFEFNMSLTGVIVINGEEQQSANYEIGAFCGDQCRGSVMPMYFAPTQRYIYQLTVFGETGDLFTFRIFDHETSRELRVESPEAVAFNIDGYGSLRDPYLLNFTQEEIVPHWIPEDGTFENSMPLTGVILIDGLEQYSDLLEMGAFCGSQCRGSVMPKYFAPTQRFVVQLPVFGETGDMITFKLYDHETEAELDLQSPEAVAYDVDGYGSLRVPYELNFTSVSTVTQTVELVEGWNWFSSYIDLGDPVALLDMLKEALGENGVEIQSYDDNTEYYDGEWFGGLDESGITNDKTFLILVSNDCTFELEGPVVDPTTVSITLHNGWNWIGFPFDHEVEIAVAFADFNAEEGDVIQTSTDQTEFDGDEWFGDIETLLPGQGVMYFSNSETPKVLVFHIDGRSPQRKAGVR